MHAYDSTLYTSATTANEMTATLNKELQVVSEWVARNKLSLNISKTKSTTGTQLDIHAYPTRHSTKGLFTVSKSRTDYGRQTVLHRAMTTWNSIPHQVTDASSKIRFKKKNTLWNSGDCEATNIGTNTCIHTQTITSALNTHGFCTVDVVVEE